MNHKIFDAHTDILYDIYVYGKHRNKARFVDYHLPQLQKSVIKGGIWTLYSPEEFDLLDALKESISLIDFSKLNDFQVILGLESIRNVKDFNELSEIYKLGIRHAMLTWNEENKYATGVNGPKERGLTEEGKKVLDFMIEHDMIIDVSHLNEQSFYDVLNYTNHNILASHSNIKTLCDHRRNLDDNQLKRLKEANGLLGLTLVGSFISSNPFERTLRKFVEHIKYAVDFLGIDNVCIGFDFMDYFDDSVGKNIDELETAESSYKLIEALYNASFTSEEIAKITYENFYRRFKRQIYYGGNNNE